MIYKLPDKILEYGWSIIKKGNSLLVFKEVPLKDGNIRKVSMSRSNVFLSKDHLLDDEGFFLSNDFKVFQINDKKLDEYFSIEDLTELRFIYLLFREYA